MGPAIVRLKPGAPKLNFSGKRMKFIDSIRQHVTGLTISPTVGGRVGTKFIHVDHQLAPLLGRPVGPAQQPEHVLLGGTAITPLLADVDMLHKAPSLDYSYGKGPETRMDNYSSSAKPPYHDQEWLSSVWTRPR